MGSNILEIVYHDGVSDAPTRPRGRPRLFDEEAVLDELTALFWRKGYSQTSVADLVDATGVHKSSLYSTFGTKEELFARVLRHYLEVRMDGLSALVERAGPGIEGVHTFLDLLSDEVSETDQHGCLLVNSSTELGGTTPGFQDFGASYRSALWERLRVLISQAEPESANEELTDKRTDLFVTFLFGLNATTRGGGDEAEIERAIDAMHATVDTWRP